MAKPPTNTDIYREVIIVQNTMKDFEQRLRPLENWKIAYEAAAQALDKVSGTNSANTKSTINKDFVSVVLKFITFLTALVGLFYLIIQALTK